MTLRAQLRNLARRAGYDIVRFPQEGRLLSGHIRTVFDRLAINCVLDVGAHWGEYGVFLRDIGYRGRIVSFEPVLANVTELSRRSRPDPLWKTHHLALGSRSETAVINVMGATDLSSLLAPSEYGRFELGHNGDVSYKESVTVKRLDELFTECIHNIETPRVFLKIDTQGWDLEVLRGAEMCLDQILGLQSEISVQSLYDGVSGYTEAISFMTDLGFDLSGLFAVYVDKQLRVAEFDCVMIRTGSPDVKSSAL